MSPLPESVDSLFWNEVNKLNEEQRKLFDYIKDKIETDANKKESSEQLLLFISGGVGSGKSFLLQFIAELIKSHHPQPEDGSTSQTEVVQVCSLIGRVAQQVAGKTLHSLFPLPIHRGFELPLVPENEKKYKQMQWLIIDDVSLVSYENLRTINKTLQIYKKDKKRPFGGVNVLLFGDLMQLWPVDGHWCFEQPKVYLEEPNLWESFLMYELTTNVRHSGDVQFAELLNTLRFGMLDVEQQILLRRREKVPLEGAFEDGAALRVFPSNDLVGRYNSKMIKILRDQGHEIFKILAIDRYLTSGSTPPVNKIPENDSHCGGLPSSIELGIGQRVMLRRKIYGQEGLENGVVGVIQDFIWDAATDASTETPTQRVIGQMPRGVKIDFDDPAIGVRIISPVTAIFDEVGNNPELIERCMLPLINLGWAITIHKLQGTSLENGVVDLSNIFGRNGHAKLYVALGCVKTLKGLALPDLNRNVFDLVPDPDSFAEMCRLRDRAKLIIEDKKKMY